MASGYCQSQSFVVLSSNLLLNHGPPQSLFLPSKNIRTNYLMSLTTTATTTVTAMDRRTYWCHECDMSISLIPSTTDVFTCPHCNSDFLEELDSPITFNNHPSFPPITPSDDDSFILDNVINQSFNSNPVPNLSITATPTGTTSGHNSPASKSSIEGIPTVKITAGFLEIDSDVMCAVCKDQFVIDDETKELPCKHMYHPDCILPWLSQHNSCPVCRFLLPIEPPVDGESKFRRRSRSRVLRFGDFMDRDNDEEELLGFGLRYLARRHRLVFPMRRNQEDEVEVLVSPTQIGEDGGGGGSGRTDSVETVSSWANWPVNVDEGEIAATVTDDADVVMS